ncbi:MAG: acetyl-CoA carboxylase biotin carboxyl carrier protein [Oscillospiraceae bacterium]|nr:acetyl-CoA carboxylase biotin carboxyl carrier protein [Oscillospiraceae bacterium]
MSVKIENSMECIDALIDKMLEKGIGRLAVSEGDFKIEIETAAAKAAVYPAPVQAVPVQAPAAAAAEAAKPLPCGKIVKSPIVGTYYSSPAPDKPPFVKVGQKVKKGDVLMIIESMKLMNEIASEFDGVVAEILVENGTPVEFDQPIMRIE